ncbi:uncharacterized protein METZ01_LOCUS280625, partial [marine metagenome]
MIEHIHYTGGHRRPTMALYGPHHTQLDCPKSSPPIQPYALRMRGQSY